MEYKDVNSMPINDVIVTGFKMFYAVARNAVARGWLGMSHQNRVNSASCLVYMRAVSKNPDKYFSYESTYKDWFERAHDFKQSNNFVKQESLENILHNYVQTPESTVYEIAPIAFKRNRTVYNEYKKFCRLVREIEYAIALKPNGADMTNQVMQIRKIVDMIQELAGFEESRMRIYHGVYKAVQKILGKTRR